MIHSNRNYPVIAIIGAGHMGTSLIAGLIRSGHPSEKIWATAKTESHLMSLKEKFHINITTDNRSAVREADIVIFAIKPQVFKEVAREVQEDVATRKLLVISIAAGLRLENIASALGANIPIIRAMPNMPARLQLGATGLCANALTTPFDREIAETILATTGITCWVDREELMEVITALSGNGPAYFFLLMEALQQTAEELGLPKETARCLTLQTALGAAHMAVESNEPLAKLRQSITSPGGTTEKAISVLEKHDFRNLIKETLQAATERAKELASKFGN